MSKTINVTVNGVAHKSEVEPRMLLVHFLRDALNLTGTHVGCETSLCGACTVLLDGQAVKSCTLFAVQAASGSGRFLGAPRIAVRLLHSRDDHGGSPDSGTQSRSQR